MVTLQPQSNGAGCDQIRDGVLGAVSGRSSLRLQPHSTPLRANTRRTHSDNMGLYCAPASANDLWWGEYFSDLQVYSAALVE